MKSIWEEIPNIESSKDGTTFRMRVPGGWVIRHRHIIYANTGFAEAMCFVVDPNHEWVID